MVTLGSLTGAPIIVGVGKGQDEAGGLRNSKAVSYIVPDYTFGGSPSASKSAP